MKRKDRKSKAWFPIRAESPEELFEELLRRHPQYRRAYERGELVIDNGQEVNPALHLQLHLIVEQQIRDGDPDFVGQAALRLERAGIHPHDVRHLLATPMVYQTYSVVKGGGAYNRDEHRLAVEEILRKNLPL
ncbi:DUF1841 family protein [bacterium]|nr:DUF1841 family protein [bacterium]